MTITAETYTTANGSNMDTITYSDYARVRAIADDLKQYDGWDYAIITDDSGEIMATVEHDATMTIKDPISGKNTMVSIDAHADVDEGTFYYVTYHAHASTEVDCWFGVIEHENDMVCQSDWQTVGASQYTIPEYEWVDCTPNNERGEYTITEAAEILGISRQRVHVLIQRGQLDAFQLGNMWLIRRYSVENRKSNS